MKILGVSCYYHDSAAAYIKDGDVVAAVEEERFTREKHDNSFPENAIKYCLNEGDIGSEDLDRIVFYEKPMDKFARILETAGREFPQGYRMFSEAVPEWIDTKLRFKSDFSDHFNLEADIEYTEHHRSHAASAFSFSPFKRAAILTVDGVGERITNQMHIGKEDGQIKSKKHIEFPHSLGLLYSSITAYLGFMVNNDEYKVMGLASYGENKYEDEFNRIIDVSQDGSYALNQKYFSFTHAKKMWSDELEKLLGDPRGDGDIEQRHKDVAASLQKKLEDVLMKQVNHLYEISDTENLCMAGGVALNSAANGTIKNQMPFENIWIQPAAGDDGGALGAAALRADQKISEMEDVYYGPSYDSTEVKKVLNNNNADYEELETERLVRRAAEKLANGEIISLYQGRLEWGPRALGNRSILADPRDENMIDVVNKKVKFREEFRPFAPTVLEDEADSYFEVEGESPYMLFVHDVVDGKEDVIPAVTHVNGTSRIQTLERETNELFYRIISEFEDITGVPVVLNTSFNLKGMPIVNTPEQAYKNCFKQSGIDTLFTENFCITE